MSGSPIASAAGITGKVARSFHRLILPMTAQTQPGARAHVTPAGLMFLAITSVGWGFNWPVTKYLLSELPPLTLRGGTGVIGAALLALLALVAGQSLRVPRELWPRLVLAALLNVACWMVLMGLALLWLPASEAALIAYTMPVWASLLAWPMLGERPNGLRVISLVMAFAGLSAIMGGNGIAASLAKLPGIMMALGGSIGFAVGTVLVKKLPLDLPPLSAAAWQIGIGCLPVAVVGLLIERADLAALIADRLAAAGLFDRDPVLRRLCRLVRGAGAAAGLGRRDRHHGGAGDRRGGVGAGAARAARPRPDRGAGLHARPASRWRRDPECGIPRDSITTGIAEAKSNRQDL